MKIRTKILGGFLIIAFLGLALGVTSLVMTNRLVSATTELHDLQTEASKFSNILNAHYAWRNSLTETILTGKEFTGSLDPATCALGKWMSSDSVKKMTDAEILDRLNKIKSPHEFIHHEANTVMAYIDKGETDNAFADFTDVIMPRFTEVITEFTGINSKFSDIIDVKNEEIDDIGRLSNAVTVVMLIIVMIASVSLALIITGSIIKPLQKLTETANELANGNLEIEAEYNVDDQIGKLAESFRQLIEATRQQVAVSEMLADGNLTAVVKPRSPKDTMCLALGRMLDNLNVMFMEIINSTTQVSNGSKQIADGAQALAQGSVEQASAVDQLSSSVGNIASKTNQNAGIAREAAVLSGRIKDNAEKGSKQMEQMMRAVREINDASSEIGKVIKVIDDIAFQTNILALNAAVEAARAGQHGKGFAVVAEEVRNLAAKSADAAKDTGGLIENSITKANLGMQIANETSASLDEIVNGIVRSAEIVDQIARSSDEQASAISQVHAGLDQVARVVQTNSATAQESAAASQQMSSQSNTLEQLTSRFVLKNAGRAAAPRALPGKGGMPRAS